MDKNIKIIIITTTLLALVIGSLSGAVMGYFGASLLFSGHGLQKAHLTAGQSHLPANNIKNLPIKENVKLVNEESAVISTVKKVSPAVVSIIITKDLPIIEKYYTDPFDFFGLSFPHYRQNGTRKQEIGGGTGFLVSADGYIITNRHVVADEDAEYTVLMNDESKHKATVLARDQYNDVAVLKIEGDNYPYIEFCADDNLQVGQSVITIGNSLGEFRNTVSTGVISGLARNVTAGGSGGSEELVDLIQTDAAINPGNSGGPLLNLRGEVIGVNTAIAQNAENIGFAIPVGEIKPVFESVRANGRIVRPWLGVRYAQINKDMAAENNLSVDYGALLVNGLDGTPAIISGSPADKAGLKAGDIILEINGEKLDKTHPLSRVIGKLKPNDKIDIKILRDNETKNLTTVLTERLPVDEG